MSSIKPRGKVPKEASVDEIIEIKTLIKKEIVTLMKLKV